MLSLDKYKQIMFDELDELNEDQLMALDQIQLNKRKVERAYNMHAFGSKGDMVWKLIFLWDKKIQNVESGVRIRKDPLQLVRYYPIEFIDQSIQRENNQTKA